jgi:hypothetical protein
MTVQREALPRDTSRAGRWLRERRLRAALLIAVVEGALVAFDVIPWWLAVLVAAAAIAVYFWAGRQLASDAGRQMTWIAAASQALVVLVPFLVFLVGTLALIAVGILAVIALVVLFSERD